MIRKMYLLLLFACLVGESLAQQNIRKNYEYYPNGRFKSVLYSNGAYREYSYSNNGNRYIVKEREANKITIQPLEKLTFCQGSFLRVKYKIEGVYNADNTFTLEISDKNGNFDNLKVIGEKKSTQEGTIAGILPNNLPVGNGYKLRIRSSSFAVYSEAYPTATPFVTVTNPLIPIPAIVRASGSHTNTIILTAEVAFQNPKYQWVVDLEDIAGETNKTYKVATMGKVQVIVQDTARNCDCISDDFYEAPTALQDSLAQNVLLYPNPTGGRVVTAQFTLPTYAGKAFSVDIHNAQGNHVKNLSFARLEERHDLNLEGLPAGTYLVSFRLSGNIMLQKKLVLQ